jgi:hypothetical protein
MNRELFIQGIYLTSSILFILGLKSLSHPDKARLGMQQAALGMVLAIVGTLFHHEIVRYDFISVGLILGTVIGYPLGMFVPMTAMPQRIAISHMFGALAATLVGIAEYHGYGGAVPRPTMAALGLRCSSEPSPSPEASWPSGSSRNSSPGDRSPTGGRTRSTSPSSRWRSSCSSGW